jgi:hypothetical protein
MSSCNPSAARQAYQPWLVADRQGVGVERLSIGIPHEPFNSLVRAGTAGPIIRKILEDANPEAVYFTQQHGARGAML